MKQQTYKLIFIALLLGLCVSGVQANAFSAWSAYGDAWKATNDTYIIVMWNQTGTHTWLATGNASSVDCLVVAGGGAGGGSRGAGGGAGGTTYNTGISVSSSVNIVVGSGGAGVNGGIGKNGTYSLFGSINNTGGGGGVIFTDGNGRIGGSGGGGASYSSGGAGISGQGSAGGNGSVSFSGGGGGKGGVGGNAIVSTNGGNGGLGYNYTSIFGTSVGESGWFASGGGAGGVSGGYTPGTASVGGGGAGVNTGVGISGDANTGGGGGGAGDSNTGGAGGSGIVIIEYLIPIASFNATPTTGVNPLTVTFNDTTTSGTPITSYNVSFGDGSWRNDTTFPATNITHLYSTAGNYTVNWYVSNAEGTRTASTTITVWGPVHSAFSLFNGNGTAPHTTYLYDLSTNLTPGPATYAWVLGDGNTSTSKDLYYTWNKTGTYNVTHTASNGLSSSTSFTNVTVGNQTAPAPAVIAPVASFYGSPTTGNVPLTVSFTDVSSNTPTSWFWEFGDGTNSTAQNPSHAYNRSGFKNVALTATNSAGSNVTVRLKFVRVS